MIRSGCLAVALGVCLALPASLSAQSTVTGAKTSAAAGQPGAAPATSQASSGPTSSGQLNVAKLQSAPAGARAGEQPVQNIMAMLSAIDPYRPTAQLQGTVHVYGSTAMDNMAHAWADEFKQFHPQVKVEIAAAGSGDAFEQLKQNPQAMVMLSRPVKPEELEKLKSEVVKEPVAFSVAREALGVFVHGTNPIKAINGEQLRTVFTKETPAEDLKWKLLGVTGPMGEQPIRLVARSETSGTQSFLRDFVFGGIEMRTTETSHRSNSDVLGALGQDPLAITICGLRANAFSVRTVPLLSQGVAIPSDDAAVLNGQYPLTRSLTLVVDLSQKQDEAKAAQELVHFALCRSGQLAAIRAGFFPAALPTLKAGLTLLQRDQFR